MKLAIKLAGTVAAATAIGVTGLVAYDHGRSDGKGDRDTPAVFIDRTSLDVLAPDGAVALRRDDVTRHDRFDLYVGPRFKLRMVGSYDGTTGRLTIVQK